MNIRIRKNAWQSWYPKKEEIIDEDMPMIEEIFRKSCVSRILDAGCGTGRHSIYFAEKGFKVYGFDFAPNAVKHAKERLTEKDLKANLRIWDARKKFPYRDEFFDAVLSIRVFHHNVTSTIEEIVNEFARVIRKDGYIYVQVPTRQRSLKYVRVAKQRGKPLAKLEEGTYVLSDVPEKGVPHHGFTRNELKELFRDFRMKSLTLRDEHYNLLGLKK